MGQGGSIRFRDVLARSFSSAGTPLANEFQVHTHTTGDQPTVTPTPTSSRTPTAAPTELYGIPALSRGAMTILTVLLMAVWLALLLRRKTRQR